MRESYRRTNYLRIIVLKCIDFLLSLFLLLIFIKSNFLSRISLKGKLFFVIKSQSFYKFRAFSMSRDRKPML